MKVESDLFSASVAKQETKTGEQIQITEGSTVKLIRERSCGRNIFDAEQTVISKNADGSIKKSVIKETYGKMSIRKNVKVKVKVTARVQTKMKSQALVK